MNDRIELRHLRYFAAVSETLHFGHAAEKLGMAQPPLSQQIRNLERNLGYPLFDRTTRGVKLTRVGQFFLERARTTLAKVADDVEMARRLGSGLEGSLTVGFAGSVMFTGLPKAIRRYRRMHPNVELRLREGATEDQMPLLLDGTLRSRIPARRRSARRVDDRNHLAGAFVAVLPARHKLAVKSSLQWSALKDEPFVLFCAPHGRSSLRPHGSLLRSGRLSPELRAGRAAMAHGTSAGGGGTWVSRWRPRVSPESPRPAWSSNGCARAIGPRSTSP